MKYAVLGTGMVGQALATKLTELGHEVRMGSRTKGNEKAVAWVQTAGANGSEGTFADAAAFGECVLNCSSGQHALAVLESAGTENLKGKVLIDVSNPLDFSNGFPPSLSVANTDSLAEQIQRAHPEAKVVKTLNTVNCGLMVDPGRVPGDHVLFVAGNDDGAKAQVVELLGQFGWPAARVVDGGDIGFARATEAFLLLWTRLYGKFGHADFNFELRMRNGD